MDKEKETYVSQPARNIPDSFSGTLTTACLWNILYIGDTILPSDIGVAQKFSLKPLCLHQMNALCDDEGKVQRVSMFLQIESELVCYGSEIT